MATEKRLIDATKLIRRIVAERDSVKIETGCDIGYHNGLNMALSMAINAPTVDAVEVVHGEWEKCDILKDCKHEVDMCSICNNITLSVTEKASFCAKCGAKMDGDGNGNL